MKEAPYQYITSEEQLQSLVGEPSKLAVQKVINHLDEESQRFIQQSPLLIMATADCHGKQDASPRGDAPGFIHIIDDKHFLIPERPGNRRVDSMKNLLKNPHVGLLFIIPGLDETLRINGKAAIIRDKKWLEKMSVNGRAPLLAIKVTVEECFVHCAKAFKRSHLWDMATWPIEKPSPTKMLALHAKLPDKTEADIEKQLIESYQYRLY